MIRRYALVAISLAITILPAPLRAQATPAEQSATTQAGERGRLIYAYDQAAWHGTDAMMAQIPDPQNVIGGWIVDGPADAPTLIFFDQNASAPQAVFTVEFRDGKLASARRLAPTDDRTLSPARIKLIAARNQALNTFMKARLATCSEKINTVVLPDAQTGGAHVYVLAPQPDMRTFPIGGNYRIDVAADGKASAPRAFANTCISMTVPPDAKEPEAFFVTHLLDPVPTEIHVFVSLASRVPVMVGTTTNDNIWAVQGSKVSFLRKMENADTPRP